MITPRGSEREMLMQAAPETFYITDHYADWPMVLINLTTVRWDAMPDILERAWRRVATPGLVKQYDASETDCAKTRSC